MDRKNIELLFSPKEQKQGDSCVAFIRSSPKAQRRNSRKSHQSPPRNAPSATNSPKAKRRDSQDSLDESFRDSVSVRSDSFSDTSDTESYDSRSRYSDTSATTDCSFASHRQRDTGVQQMFIELLLYRLRKQKLQLQALKASPSEVAVSPASPKAARRVAPKAPALSASSALSAPSASLRLF